MPADPARGEVVVRGPCPHRCVGGIVYRTDWPTAMPCPHCWPGAALYAPPAPPSPMQPVPPPAPDPVAQTCDMRDATFFLVLASLVMIGVAFGLALYGATAGLFDWLD